MSEFAVLPGWSIEKWQSRKDSNLDKVNQNHLCYHYTTGLRPSSKTAYTIARGGEKTSPVRDFFAPGGSGGPRRAFFPRRRLDRTPPKQYIKGT